MQGRLSGANRSSQAGVFGAAVADDHFAADVEKAIDDGGTARKGNR
jgi:hypothetical protein